MAVRDNRLWLYNNLSQRGVDLGKYEEFDNALNTKDEARKWVFEQASSTGLDVGSWDEYANAIFPANTLSWENYETKEQPQDAMLPYIQEHEERMARRNLGFLQRKEEERKAKAKEQKRIENASLPITEEDARNEALINFFEFGKIPSMIQFGVDENGLPIITKTEEVYLGGEEAKKQNDELKAKRPEYLSRGNETGEDVISNVIDAWTANTEAGKTAMKSFETAEKAIDADIERDYKSYFNQLQQQVYAGKLTVDDANKKLKQKENELNEIAKSLKQDKYSELIVNPAIDANEDYIKKMDVKITNATVDETITELMPILTKKYDEYRQGAFGGMREDGSFPTVQQEKDSRERELYSLALEEVKDAQKMKEAADDKAGFWRSMGETLGDKDTWDLGLNQLRSTSEWKRIVEKFQENGEDESKLTEGERMYMKSMLTYLASCSANSDRLSSYYKMGQSTAESIPFMLQFLAMPISGIEQGVSRGLIKLGINLFGKEAMRTGSSLFVKALAGTTRALIGTAVAAGAQTLTFSVPKIVEGSLDRQMGDVLYKRNDVDKAFQFGGIREGSKQTKFAATKNSIWDQYVENLSEIAFDSLAPLGEYFQKAFLRPTLKMFNAIGLEEFPRSIIRFNNNSWVKALRKDVRLGGIIEEALEEELGSLLRLMCSDVNSLEDAGFTAEQQKEMILGLIPMQVAFGFMGGVHYTARTAREHRDYKDFRASLDNDTQRILFDRMMSASKHGEFGNATYDLMRDIISDKYTTQEKKVEKMEKILATYRSKLSLEVQQAADNYVEQTYAPAAKAKAEKLANESVEKGAEQFIYLTKDEKGRDIAIKGGKVSLVNHTVDGVTYTVLNPVTSDKNVVVGFPQSIAKEDKPKLRTVAVGKLSAPVVKMTIGEYMDFVLDAQKAAFLGEGSFEHDGKFYDVETMEEVVPQQDKPKTVQENQLPDPIRDNQDVPFTLAEGEVVTYTDKKGKVHQMTSPVFKSGEYYVLGDGTLYVKEGQHFSIRDNGQPLTKKERRSALDSINKLIKQRKANERENAIKAAEEAAARKAADEQAAKEAKAKESDMNKIAAEGTKKNGELDEHNATPEQIVCYFMTHFDQVKALDYIKRYMVRMTNEKADAKDELQEAKLDLRIDAFYAAVNKWISEEVEKAMRAAVAEETKPAPVVETPAPAAPVAKEEPKKEEPKKETPKEPKTPKVDTPQQPKVETPAMTPAPEPAPEKPARQKKARKAPGFEEGMDVFGEGVYLVKDAGGRLSLVKADKMPEKAVKKQRIYLDAEGKQPFLLWSSAPVASTRGNIKYVDAEGNIQEVSRASVYMEEVVDNQTKKIVPVPTPQRRNVTTFDTILKSKLKVEGEEYTIADFLTTKEVGETKKKGGEGKKALNGYQRIVQHINERADLTAEQKANALAEVRRQINEWIDSWNSLAKNVLINETGLKDKDLMPGYAMNLSIYRDLRDKYAKAGNIEEVQKIQAKILDMTFQVSHADETNLTRDNFFNPLYQLTLMVEMAQKAGILKGEEQLATSLPAALQRIANSELVLPKDIESARSIYAKEKEKKHKTGSLEKEFPEVKNSLPALIRFARPTSEKGKRAQSNKWYDKTLAEVYKQMEAALKRIEEEKKGGEALAKFKQLLAQTYVLVTNKDEAAVAKANEAILAELEKHKDDPAFQKAFDDAQKKVTKYINSLEENKEAVHRATVLQERRDLEAEKVNWESEKTAANKRDDERQKKGKARAERYVVERASNEIATIDTRIAELEKENDWLADELLTEKDIASLQELNRQMEEHNDAMAKIMARKAESTPKGTWTEADQQAAEKEKENGEKIADQMTDIEEGNQVAKDRFRAMLNSKSTGGLDLSVHPEMAVADENGIPAKTPHTRLILKTLGKLFGFAGIQPHYAGNQEQARNVLSKLSGYELIESPNGIILGWAIGNEIWLTDEGMNSETPIHEYTHLWVKSLRNEKPEAWEKIKALLKKNKRLWDEIVNDSNYENIKDDEDAIASELLARYSGKNGAKRLEEMARKIVQKSGVNSEKAVQSLIDNMRNALQEFWRVIKNLFLPNSNVTVDEIADLVLKDLFDGKPLNLNTQEMNEIKEQAVKNGTFMKAPNGRDTKLTERQWLSVRTKAFKETFGDWENDPENATKILDENGEPMVVFHGTEHAGFDLFDPQDNGESNGRGIFTTPQRFVAGVYAKMTGDEGTEYEARLGQEEHRGIYSLFANIKNPMVVDCFNEYTEQPSMWNAIPTGIYKIEGMGIQPIFFESLEDAQEWMYEHGFGLEWTPDQEEIGEPEIIPETMTTDEFVDLAREQGYDGVVFHNIIDGTDSNLLEDESDDSQYMQAHDVIVAMMPNQLKSAVTNNGMYSQGNDRIEFSIAEQRNQNSDDIVTAEKEEAGVNAEDVLTQPGLDDMTRRDKLMDWVTKALDQTNGIRIIMNSINAFRKVMGKGPIPDSMDVRTIFESARAKGNNQYVQYEFGLKKEFDDTIREWGKAIEKLPFFQEHRQEVGGEKPAKLTPQQFLERYLLAKNDIERAKEGVARGLEVFAERMGMSVEEFVEQFEAQFPKEAIGKLWIEIKKMTDFSLKIQLEGEILTQEEYDDYAHRKYYVPQRGFWDEVNPENDEQSTENRRPGKRRIKTSGMRKAKGGESLAAGCLAFIYRDVIESIEKANSNMVKRAMFDLLRDNDDWCRAVGFPVPQEIDFTIIDGKVVKMIDGLTEVDIKQMHQSIKENAKRIADIDATLETYRTAAQMAQDDELQDILEQINELTAEKNRLEIENEKNREVLPDVSARRRDIYGQAKHSYDDTEGDPHLVPLCVNGVATLIQFPEKHILTAAALNGNRDHRGEVKPLRALTSWLSTKFTVQNPVFFSTNIVRDYPFVLQKGGAEYGPLFMPTFFHYWNTSHAAVWEYLITHKVPDSDAGAQLQDFLDKGGNTGFSLDEDIQSWRDHVQDLNPGMTWEKFLSGTGQAIDWLTLAPVAEVLNEWSEIVTRFAAYRAVVKLGYGVNEGIKAAHNLSTNFNRKGLGWPLLNFFNSLTVFSNAAIQGASGLWRTFGGTDSKAETAKRIAGAMTWVIFVPALVGFIDTLCNPDDDDKEYAISDYDRANYVILGSGRIALSQELKPWWNIGVNAALMMRGRRSSKTAANAFLTSLVENTLPVPQNLVDLAKMGVDSATGEQRPDLITGISQGVTRIFMPAALDPFAQVAENRNFMGGKIRYDFGDMPEYKMAPSEAALLQDLSYAWYRIGGGSKYVNSLVKDNGDDLNQAFNLNPKQIRSMLFMVPSGVMDLACLEYGFAKDLYNKATGKYDETSIRSKDVPIFNRFYRENNPDLYRYGIIKESRQMVEKWNNERKNALSEITRYGVLASNTRDANEYQGYISSMEEAQNRLSRLESDVVMQNMSDIMNDYNEASIRSIARSLGLNEKEYKKFYPDAAGVLNFTEQELVKELLSGVKIKKGLRWDKNNPGIVNWFDDLTGYNKEEK